jgi:hypothetical protein
MPYPAPYTGGGDGGAGVPTGVPLGVEFALSTRVLRELDLGVMLCWRRAISSRKGATSERGAFRDGVGVDVCAAAWLEPAILGVNGVLLPALAAALRVGRSGRAALCLLS